MNRTLAVLSGLILFVGCGRPGSNPDVVTTPGTPAASIKNSRALLSWSAATGFPDGYIVYQSQNESAWTATQTVTQTSTYVDGLSASTSYFFKIASYNSSGTTTSTSTLVISL